MPINTTHPLYNKHLPQWRRCRDTVTGTDSIKAGQEKYLPRLDAQNSGEYRSYLQRATFYGASKRTVQGLTGTVFRKPTHIEGFSSMEALESISAQKRIAETLKAA